MGFTQLTTPYHSDSPEDKRVYHWYLDCSEGKKILPQHKRQGQIGSLCEVCSRGW